MNAKEKIKYVKDKIKEAAEISPKGPFRIGLHSLDMYEDGPTIISRGEQWSIVKKLEQEGYIKNAELDEKKLWAWVELVPKPEPKQKATRRSNLLSYIKSTDELIQHRGLFQKFLGLLGNIADIKPKHSYKYEAEEKDDDLIQLLIDLKVVVYDWDKMREQTHRNVGDRIIEFTFEGGKALALYNRVSGNGGFVRKEALELIAKEIGDRMTLAKIVAFFTGRGVPESMFVQDTKWRAVFYVLSYFTTSEVQTEHIKFLKLIEEVLHPLMFEGDEEKAKEARGKYAKWLKYDRILVDDDGKVYLGPTEEEMELGMDDWVDANGKVIEPKSYLLYPDHIAKLYVLWNQILLLISAYQYNAALDRKTMEKLYLEVIGKVEDLIYYGKLGRIKETYKRPFSSLATADIEAQAKKANSALELVVAFLMEITALEPDPGEIAKQQESNADLLNQITDATRAITGEKIDLTKLTYDQALFLLRLTVGHLFDVLEVASTGYLNMTDHQLNAKYVLLSDNLQGLLQRKDFEELKKSAPDLPKHLFEALDEMDVWWEYGGQSGLMSFIGDIETAWIRAGQQTIPLPGWLLLHFNDVDALVAEHRKVKNEKWKRIEQNIDAQKERGEIPFGPKEKADNELIEVKLAAGVVALHKATGKFTFNEVSGTLNPQSQEFKVLLTLATNKNHQATYSDLLGENSSKVNKRNLTFVVRNLKEALGILPLKDAKNKDVIKNLKRHGYRLIT